MATKQGLYEGNGRKLSVYIGYLHHKMGLGISQDHSLLAHEVECWSGCRQQFPQKSSVIKKSNCSWLSADHPNNAKLKEVYWNVLIQRYSGSCSHESNNVKQNWQMCPAWAWLCVPPVQKKGCPNCRVLSRVIGIWSKVQDITTKVLVPEDIFLKLAPQDRSMPLSKYSKDLYLRRKKR